MLIVDSIDMKALMDAPGVVIDTAHDWGYQIRMVNEPEYSAKFLVLTEPEVKGSYHHHGGKKETMRVLQGKAGYKDYKGGTCVLSTGSQVTLLPGQAHQMWAIDAPALILEVATHDDDRDTHRISK